MADERIGRVLMCVMAGCGAVVVAVGCSSTRPPRFEVVGVELSERTAEAHVLTFTVEGENPNREALPLRAVRYSLVVDGRQVFRGERSAQATLPPFGKQRFEVPAVVLGPYSYEGASYRFGGTVEYLEPGTIAEILFDSNVRRSRGGFQERGRLTDQGVESVSVER